MAGAWLGLLYVARRTNRGIFLGRMTFDRLHRMPGDARLSVALPHQKTDYAGV